MTTPARMRFMRNALFMSAFVLAELVPYTAAVLLPSWTVLAGGLVSFALGMGTLRILQVSL